MYNLGGWLTTVVSRVCLDLLRSRASRREDLVGQYQPDDHPDSQREGDPEQEALIADAVGRALLVVLGTLAPAERIAFVLHDMFAVPFDDIAPALVNGDVGIVVAPHGRLLLALTVEVTSDKIASYELIADPGRLDSLIWPCSRPSGVRRTRRSLARTNVTREPAIHYPRKESAVQLEPGNDLHRDDRRAVGTDDR